MFAQKVPRQLPQVRRGFARARRRPIRPLGCGWLALAVLLALIGGVAALVIWPGIAAQNIDHLRDIIGDRAVAQLEDFALAVQDDARLTAFEAGWVKPSAPWSAARPSPTPLPGATPVPSLPAPPANDPPASSSAPAALSAPPAPSQPAWQLDPLSPMGSLSGEGLWSPYIQPKAGGEVLAYRTFFQPDPHRPYSVVAVVAFDLAATRLHFVLGTIEPWSGAVQQGRSGKIPASDMQPGVLLATFNGGFKARHGGFGAMAGGITALPPTPGLATVGMYSDGSVRMGIWGNDIDDSADLVAWRQNSKPLVRNGVVNPATSDLSERWGLTVDYKAITWRSALGLSADRRTLYYAAGPEVDVKTIAEVMAHVRADQAMELDVNDFWVNFAAIRAAGGQLVAEPLLPGMNREVDRYLKGYTRDYFYVTVANP